MQLDPGALSKAQELFTVAMKALTVESLMDDPTPDAKGNLDPNDRARAQEKFNLLTGKYGTRKDKMGRSNMLATFLALSQVDPNLRRMLRETKIPKGEKIDFVNQKLDEALENTADRLIDKLSNKVIGGKIRGNNVGQVIDQLAEVLGEIEKDDRTILEVKASEFMTEANGRISAVISKGAELVTDMITPDEHAQNTSQIRKHLNGLRSTDLLETNAKPTLSFYVR